MGYSSTVGATVTSLADVTMPPRVKKANADWPECYGFAIYGGGPCYVIHVQHSSVAQSAGLCPGDQLLEVDGRDVTDMSADAIKKLAARSRSVPPTVGVVTRLQHAELVASRRWGYGMTLKGVRPTLVEAVDPPGPAYQVGIRKGDIVLEINGRKVSDLGRFLPLLVSKYGRVTVAVIPVDQSRAQGAMEDRIPGQASRVRKARDLFAKMNTVLGGDFEKKMAVTGLLKQYAEDRNIETFADALSIILTTAQQRHLVREIRPFIPVNHRSTFDTCLGYDQYDSLYDLGSSIDGAMFTATGAAADDAKFLGGAPHHAPSQHTKTVIVGRGRGNFGFVLRGHDPVTIETIVAGGPADRAGLRAGDTIVGLNGLDVRKCSHNTLIKLLQSSGNNPKIEVALPDPVSHSPYPYPVSPDSIDDSRSSSPASSHVSLPEWPPDGEPVFGGEGQTFKDKVDYLLTAREKTSFRKALMEYNMERNIAQFTDEISFILDTESKKTLWGYLLPRMTYEHKQYVLRYVTLSRHQLHAMETLTPMSSRRNTLFPKSSAPGTLGHSLSQELQDQDGRGANNSSFKQQLDFLLTSRERLQLKRALQIYAERKNVKHLLEDLGDILETPSKQGLWVFIVPLLSAPHQLHCQQTLGLPEHVVRQKYPHRDPVRPTETRRSRGISATPRRGDVMFQQDDQGQLKRVAGFLNHNAYLPDSSEDEADFMTRSDALRSARSGHVLVDSDDANSIDSVTEMIATLPLRPNVPGGGSHEGEQSTITMTPIYAEVNKSAKASGRKSRVKMVRESSAQTTPVHSPPTYRRIISHHSSADTGPQEPSWDYRTFVRVYETPDSVTEIMQVEDSRHGHVPVTVIDPAVETAHTTDRHRTQTNRQSNRRKQAAISHNGTAFTTTSRTAQGRDSSQGKVPVTVIDSGTDLGHVSNGHVKVRNSRHKRVTVNPAYTTHSQPQAQDHVPVTVIDAGYPTTTNHEREEKTGGVYQPQSEQYTPLYNRRTDSSRQQHRGYSHYAQPEPTYATIPSSARGMTAVLEDVEADNNSEPSESSFQLQAMNAIQALDDVVDNEDWMTPSSQLVVAPPPPPPPPPPPLPVTSSTPLSPRERSRMNVKRMNWEKIDVVDEHTVWAKLDQGQELEDMVKYLELEQQFSTKKAKISDTFADRKPEVHIISAKKAYNISILLGHLKMPVADIKQALFLMDENVLSPELLRQLLAYAPDVDEMEKYDTYRGGMDDLSKPDQFVYQISRVPGYEGRLKAMLFKVNFAEKVEEVKANLKCIRKASLELERSRRLAKVLELVLAMGNYMNKGHSRVGEAAAFRISFLAQLDLTKTSDGKGNFLHVLADTIYTQSAEMVNLSEELPTVPEAAKVSDEAVSHELAELRKVLQDISNTVNKLSSQKQRAGVNDRFHEVMEHFISEASDEIQSLFSLQGSVHQDFQRMLQYFGEDPKTASSYEIFNVFKEFIAKFEKAHLHNMQYKRNYSKSGKRH